ncbi:MAG: thiamine phosphate synthase [Fusobacterium sp. JB021]|nr:thiamine phosphate synthase [Fusobacterium sp. JB020]MDP0492805.1 thiamine phosphate synthase [Fusobacterium sp. JB021]MDP0506400.1 thiamine phosphate synthase [Fusobacterium sp. JB019]
MRNRISIPEGIYGITGDNFSNGKSNLECVKEMIKGGIKIIQYRDKNKSINEKLKEALEIKKLCKENNVLFIVNDHIDVALLVDADGVHVGQDDLDPKYVRELIGDNKIIGLSTHSPEQGIKANLNPYIDYIGVGPIFPTTTKDTAPVGLEYLDFVINNLDIPFTAIGGIKSNNLNIIKKHGAKRVCLVSEIVGANHISDKVKELYQLLK